MKDNAVTTQDLKILEANMKAKISEVNKSISESKSTIICWLVVVEIIQLGLLLSAILKVMH